jgi:DNA-directed RNA polymerase subunit beta
MGDIPIMTTRATFIINGAERVIVSQFVRSPGVYFRERKGKLGENAYFATVIPNRGAWLEIESDKNKVLYMHVNKMKKLPVTAFLGALGYTEAELHKLFKNNLFLKATLEKGPITSREESLLEVHRKLRTGDPPTVNSATQLINGLFFDAKKYDLGQVGRYKVNKKLGLDVAGNTCVLDKKDIIAIINYIIGLCEGDDNKITDDIDHLGNRRVRSVGELLQKQFRVGLARLERLIKEQMTLKGNETIVPQSLINIRPLVAVIREFFGSSQLSQFMDQTNPLAELSHKRRLSALGPGGLSRERAGFEVRDIHPSHYGRVCPIETPEGPNAGLIGPLACFARINHFGFIETPYRKVHKGKATEEIEYMAADTEDQFRIAPFDVKLDKKGHIADQSVPVRYRKEFIITSPDAVDYMGVSPKQIFGITTALIPFLEHDDANRALMGANMQRQATPLINPEKPHIGTGMEKIIARDSGVVEFATGPGVVTKLSSREIEIKYNNDKKPTKIPLMKYGRSNQNTCRNQKPIINVGDKVHKGTPLTDGPGVKEGELALGRNVLVAFMPWEGYNFEDAIILSQRLVKQDFYSSIHINKYEVEVRTTKLGKEEITREVPNVAEETLKNLDKNGVIRVGAEVQPGDILVGKVTPKGETEPPAEEKLLRAIFGDKARDMRDTSLKIPPGETGKVIDVKIFSREKKDDLPAGVNQVVRVYVAQLRKVSIGDKMAGRHGNKGVISRILAEEDMPFLPDGTPVDVVLNPLGVPSRMNVGQVYELLLGMAAYVLKEQYEIPPFDEVYGEEHSVKLIQGKLEEAGKVKGYNWVNKSGKVILRDGRTGLPFDREVGIGCMYLLKLIHLVDDKIHARSTGPYSLVTRQPLGGKAQFGGQRFGEMEVWALEAYGAAYTLQELLTIKSDDVAGRAKAYESIIKGKGLMRPGTPESFKVLLRELRSLSLDFKIIDREGMEIDNR